MRDQNSKKKKKKKLNRGSKVSFFFKLRGPKVHLSLTVATSYNSESHQMNFTFIKTETHGTSISDPPELIEWLCIERS